MASIDFDATKVPSIQNFDEVQNTPQAAYQHSQWGSADSPPIAAPVAPLTPCWANIPAVLRASAQWCVAGPDKRPLMVDGRWASSTDPSTWGSFDSVCQAAASKALHIGYMLHESDLFSCIDLDIKAETPPEHIARIQKIVASFDSYTERSRSGQGMHIWVEGKIGKGRRRDGVEVYSQERFIICTGNVYSNRPIANRQELLNRLISEMQPSITVETHLNGDDTPDWSAAIRAIEDTGELGRLFSGDWEGRYPSQSEADMALVRHLLPITDSRRECWRTFQLSALGKREKAKRMDYARSTIAAAEQALAQIQHGNTIAEALIRKYYAAQNNSDDNDLFGLRVDWDSEDDAEVPDVVEDLVADEEVTLLGGHGGVGKSFLSLQIACAVATGNPVLGKSTDLLNMKQEKRVVYYSAEDGKKRLARRMRKIVSAFQVLNTSQLRRNLCIVDASELDPLYGESPAQNRAAAKVLGPNADFRRLQNVVEKFDPQLVIIDGASDTFDGNEIVRRDVRGFIKMLRRVHPTRSIAVLLAVHIDRSSARGNVTNDDGYAGSAQWHNSCRRRMFLQHVQDRDEDDENIVVNDEFLLRVMKNQDGEPIPDIQLDRDSFGLWHVLGEKPEVTFTGNLAAALAPLPQVDHSETILNLIREYYLRKQWIGTSLAPNASTGVFQTLNVDPEFPRGLTRKKTEKIVRQLINEGRIVEEEYRRAQGGKAARWKVVRPITTN